MKCPTCKTNDLTRQEHSAGPALHRCASCDGRWLAFDDHRQWLESQPASVQLAPVPEVRSGLDASLVIGQEPKRIRTCPRCAKLLGRFRVSADADLWLERCPACAGIWFDQGELEAAMAITSMARVQHLFNDSYQHKIAAEVRRRQHEHRCRSIVGDEALSKTRAFKTWLEQQPRQDVLRAYLDERFDAR